MSNKLVQSPDKFLISKQKWIIVGFFLVIFNPLPAGLIYGFALWREPVTKTEGKLIMIFSLIWGGISMALVRRYFGI